MAASKASQRKVPALAVRMRPFGPSAEQVEALGQQVLQHRDLAAHLKRTRHRLLSVELVDPSEKSARPRPPERFRATIYDYTNERTLRATGSIAAPRRLSVEESGDQPLPSTDEFDEAVKVVARHSAFKSALAEGSLVPYPPMPPLVGGERPDGRTERVVAVGLLPPGGKGPHEIVAVHMARREVARYESRAPECAQAHNPICGVPYASQPTAQHVAGQVWVTVTQGGVALWKFLLTRPAASSGTNGSGVELRYVDYRGKRLLYQAHVPILNVKYDPGGCGPYRDWQNQEGMIQAEGVDVAPGFRLCPGPAQTVLDTGSDVGNFLGVAIYVQGQEVVIVSEMEAGWYRYVSQWRLGADGTIRPRFGFSAVSNSCVCHVHHHHVYWRLDFDLRNAAHNKVREYNDPPLPGIGSNWHDKVYEIMRSRDPGRHRKWRVENTQTGEAYDIVPGADDGTAAGSPDAPFGRGDLWVLRYHGNEIDDGVVATGPPYEANIGGWVNGESVRDQDVVVWYGAHFTHDVANEPPGTFGDILGPDLKLVRW
jgi:hypothetical protein